MIDTPAILTPYLFRTEDGGVEIKYNSYEELLLMKEDFNSYGRGLRKRIKKFKKISLVPTEDIEKFVESYAIYLTGASFAAMKEAQLNPGPKSNPGDNHQHWIPSCYMKNFAKEYDHPYRPDETIFKTLKVHRRKTPIWDILAAGESNYFNTELINLNEIDFREDDSQKGSFYEPHFELLLALIENDYSQVVLSPRPKNLWDSIVLSVFFLLMSVRTKEYREQQKNLEAQEKLKNLTNLIIHTFPKQIANLEIRLLDRRIAISVDKQLSFGIAKTPPTSLQDFEKQQVKPMTLPFNQRPCVRDMEMDNEFSLWAICNPNNLIWLRHKKTKYIPTKTSLQERLTFILESNDFRNSYFHPDHAHWDNLLYQNARKEEIKDIITEEKLVESLRLCKSHMYVETPSCKLVKSTLEVRIQKHRKTRGFLASFRKSKPSKDVKSITGSVKYVPTQGNIPIWLLDEMIRLSNSKYPNVFAYWLSPQRKPNKN